MGRFLLFQAVLLWSHFVTFALGDDIQAMCSLDVLAYLIAHLARDDSPLDHRQTVVSVGNDKIVRETDQPAVLAQICVRVGMSARIV